MGTLFYGRIVLRNRRLPLALWGRSVPRKRADANRCVATWSPLATAFNSPHPREDRYLRPTGLFGKPELSNTSGFTELKNKALFEGGKIVNNVLQSPPTPRLVGLFDKLSDTLCAAADLAEFVRLTHPDHRFRSAAEDTSRGISSYVEELNTHPGLYQALGKMLSNEDKRQMDEETKRVAELFLFDFEQSGIHLDEEKRRLFVELQEAILVIGAQFSQIASMPVQVPLADLPMADKLSGIYPVSDGHVIIESAYLDSNNEKLRELVYLSCLKPVKTQLNTLDMLLSARHQLARLVNFPSFTHRALTGTMAKTPENVMDFLKLTANMLRKPAKKELDILTGLKKHTSKASNTEPIMPWDLHYYSSMAKYQSAKLNSSSISAYFPLGACMEGLNILFKSLFGISLETQDPAEGELWSPYVQKLGVVHETEGLLGYIYCDFFNREEKLQQDSHFTIRGE